MMTYASAKKDPRFLTLSEGNAKLKPTGAVKYLIWNIPAIKTCPYATEHCKKACYAIKAETPVSIMQGKSSKALSRESA